jgi:aldehyde dehydrogenase (NAD+)
LVSFSNANLSLVFIIAGSRLLLQETIHDQFVEKLVAMAKTAKLGDPALTETQVGR